ncbi:MAG TPA: carboxypeptidase-like regulatory domain-containing protein [Terriglobales bacterium]|nr:carboxypeptidase-like regulatory domain-containing protein [Terriglobales bacterium]
MLLLLAPLFAQTPDSATLRGRLLDPSRAAIAGVEIKITNTLTEAVRSTVTDSAGSFQFAGLPIGNYFVSAH